jgi:hypothetical protein
MQSVRQNPQDAGPGQRDLRKYFQRWHFDLSNDREIQANEGVLNIPGVALLIPLAWMTGSDLHVPCLDRTFADAIEALRQAYRRMYPNIWGQSKNRNVMSAHGRGCVKTILHFSSVGRSLIEGAVCP